MVSTHVVKAEMNATVWKVDVATGQSVSEGDVLVILESMKMEIPVPAPTGGRITTLHVAAEDAVLEGDPIAVIEAP